ncbi:hypothetical protein KCP73_06240 [Salmonella enterica subsp. enterica]|nr:hypothetical protein KCP73_06240 [Salmonella enterica subsp. enterica]
MHTSPVPGVADYRAILSMPRRWRARVSGTSAALLSSANHDIAVILLVIHQS